MSSSERRTGQKPGSELMDQARDEAVMKAEKNVSNGRKEVLTKGDRWLQEELIP